MLDVGCGPGRHALALARRGFDVVGVDLSEDFIALARDAAAVDGLPARFDTGLGDRDWGASWIRRQVSEADDYTLARKEISVGKSSACRVSAMPESSV